MSNAVINLFATKSPEQQIKWMTGNTLNQGFSEDRGAFIARAIHIWNQENPDNAVEATDSKIKEIDNLYYS